MEGTIEPAVSTPHRARRFIADYALIASGELLSKVAGFLAFAYLARLLAPPGYGAVELAVAVSMVGYLFVDFGLGPIAARAVTQSRERSDDFTGSVPAIRTVLSLAMLAAAALFGSWIARTDDERTLVLLFATALLAAPWVLDWLFQGIDRMKWVAPAQMLRMFVFLGGILAFVDGPQHLLRVGAIEIAAFGAMALYYVSAARANNERPRLAPDTATLRSLIRESAPVGGGQLLWALNQYLPTFALAAWTTSSEVAFYGAAHRVVFSLSSFIFLYFFTLYPSLVVATGERKQDFGPLTDHSLRATAWLGLLAGLMGTLLAEPICQIAFGDAFGDSAGTLAVLVWVLPINLLSGHARFALIAGGQQVAQMWAQAAGVVLTLVLGALWIPEHHALGAAYALLGSAFGVWAIAHVATSRLIAPMSAVSPLWKPALAALGIFAAATALPFESDWAKAALAATAYLGLALSLERETLRELPQLLGLNSPDDGNDYGNGNDA
jgi:O-antigen/teichoic acid export membrane protein